MGGPYSRHYAKKLYRRVEKRKIRHVEYVQFIRKLEQWDEQYEEYVKLCIIAGTYIEKRKQMSVKG